MISYWNNNVIVRFYKNMIRDQMIDLTMQVVMQFLEWMDNCKIFYIDPQKCIQYGGMSIVEDERLIPRFEVTDHCFETFCGCEICRGNVCTIEYHWNVSSSNGRFIDKVSNIVCRWEYQCTIWRDPNVLALRRRMKL